jgi:hypothetical protein
MNSISTKKDVADNKGPTGKFVPSIGRGSGEVGMGAEYFTGMMLVP